MEEECNGVYRAGALDTDLTEEPTSKKKFTKATQPDDIKQYETPAVETEGQTEEKSISTESSIESSSAASVKQETSVKPVRSSPRLSTANPKDQPKKPKEFKQPKTAKLDVPRPLEKQSRPARKRAAVVVEKLTPSFELKPSKLASVIEAKQPVKGKNSKPPQKSVFAIPEQKMKKPKSAELPETTVKKQGSQLPKDSSSFVMKEKCQSAKKTGTKTEKVNEPPNKKQRQPVAKKQAQSSDRFLSPGIGQKVGIKTESDVSADKESKDVKQDSGKRTRDTTPSASKSKVLQPKEEENVSTSCKVKRIKKEVSKSGNNEPSGSVAVRSLRSKNKKE